jgi:hypothetical protein
LFPTADLPLLVRIKISQDGDMICIDTRNSVNTVTAHLLQQIQLLVAYLKQEIL